MHDTYSYDHFDLRKWFTGIYRNKLLILGCIAITVALALFYLWRSTPMYYIQSSLVIMDENKGERMSVSLKELNFLDDQKIVENEAEILKSATIIRKVVQQLNLDVQYYRQPGPLKQQQIFYNSPVDLVAITGTPEPYAEFCLVIANDNSYYLNNETNLLYQFGDTITKNNYSFIVRRSDFFKQRDGNKYLIKLLPVNDVVQELRGGTSITVAGKNSSVLNMALLHPSPRKGTEILSSIIAEYNLSNKREKQMQTDTILSVIEKRLSLISGQLKKFETKEEKYKIQRGITQLSDDSKMFLDKAKSNDQQLTETAARLALLEGLEKFVMNPGAGLAPPTIGEQDPSLVNNVNDLNRLELERRSLESTTGAQNPALQVKLDQINGIRANILGNVQLRKNDLLNRLNELQNKKNNIESNILSVPVNERQLLELLREKNIRENIYTYLLEKREEASIKDVSVFQKMRVVDAPYSSTYPVQPKKKIILAGAVFIGFLLPLFGLGINNQLNNKVHSMHYIEKISGVKVTGEVSGSIRAARPAFGHHKNIVAEQFRRIRSNLTKQVSSTVNNKVFLLTSAVKGEGKSFVAIHLAICFSLTGKKTLLIDGDLRHPKLHKLLNMPESTLTPSAFNAVVTHPDHQCLDVIRGGISEQGSELWEGDLSGFFNELKERYDYIFVNSPPFSMFADAQQIEKYADATLFVVRHNYSTTQDVECIRKAVSQNLFKNPSVIFNNVPLSQIYDKKIVRGKYFRY